MLCNNADNFIYYVIIYWSLIHIQKFKKFKNLKNKPITAYYVTIDQSDGLN